MELILTLFGFQLVVSFGRVASDPAGDEPGDHDPEPGDHAPESPVVTTGDLYEARQPAGFVVPNPSMWPAEWDDEARR